MAASRCMRSATKGYRCVGAAMLRGSSSTSGAQSCHDDIAQNVRSAQGRGLLTLDEGEGQLKITGMVLVRV